MGHTRATSTERTIRAMPSRRSMALGLLLLCAGLSCGPAQRPGNEPAIVAGRDTLTQSQVKDLAPDTALADSLVLLRAARVAGLRSSFTKQPVDTVLTKELCEQLTLRTGVSWTPQAAGLMLGACRALVSEARTLNSPAAIQAFVDSVTAQITAAQTGKSRRALLNFQPRAFSPNEACTSLTALRELVSRTFLLPPAAADLFCEFVSSSDAAREFVESEKASDAVQDLIADRSLPAPAPAVRRAEPVVSNDDVLAALKLRSQQSIQDSILKHSIDIKSVYKIALKSNPTLQGQVWVTFRVASSGEVVDASIKKTQISDKIFTEPFLAYVKQIRFKPIREKAGDMSFVFPFEFAPE